MAKEGMARTYAQAIFEKTVEDWIIPLRTIQAGIASQGLAEKLDDAATAVATKQTWLKKVIPANTAPNVQNFLALLASKNDVHLLGNVIAEFERYSRRGPERPIARVTSAIALQDAEKKSLEAKIGKQFGGGLEFEYQADASLIGGVVVRVGDKVIDASVAGKLSALRKKLAS